MKILLVKSYFRPTSVGILAAELRNKGHEIHILIPSKSPDSDLLQESGIVVHVLPWATSRNIPTRIYQAIRIIFRMFVLIQQHDFDVVHLNLTTARLFGRIA